MRTDSSNNANSSDLAEQLYNRKAPGYPLEDFADILSRLIWALDDNGAELLAARQRWIESDDQDKVELALRMDEVYPYATLSEMVDSLSRISKRWPHLKHLCDELIHNRNMEQRENS